MFLHVGVELMEQLVVKKLGVRMITGICVLQSLMCSQYFEMCSIFLLTRPATRYIYILSNRIVCSTYTCRYCKRMVNLQTHGCTCRSAFVKWLCTELVGVELLKALGAPNPQIGISKKSASQLYGHILWI